MRKFMVVVNNKYIVAVESTSNGGAEHVVLDNTKNSKSALAYDIEAGETKWDMFQSALQNLEVVSFEDLKLKDRKAEVKKMKYMNELMEEEMFYKSEIKRLEEKLQNAKQDLQDAQQRITETERKANIDARFYSIEEMTV